MGKKAKRAKDRYYNLAKEQGLRARSAFKLIQLNRKYDFLSKSQVLIDLCAAPGGWLQVASKYMPVSSLIIGVDLDPIRPIKNVITHATDITTQKCRNILKKDMGAHKADVVLHDGAPNVGAAWIKDAYGQNELVVHSLKLATEFLKKNGLFITKVFRSADYHSLLWVFQQLFRKVEATKPHSSRTASAEIFVVCQGYLAPDHIDPKMLDPKYVFKQLDAGGPKPVNVLHQKNKAKRNRDGYADGVGPLLYTKGSVISFIKSDDPVTVLSSVHQLLFDEASQVYKEHPSTTREILACCDDLKVLGKKDYRGLLKWRSAIRREEKAAKLAAAAADEDSEEEAPQLTATEKAALEEAKVDMEMKEIAEAARMKRKRAKRKEREAVQKQVRKAAMGMLGQAVDIVPDKALFSLDTIKSAKALQRAAEVNLDTAGRDLQRAMGETESEEEESESESEVLDTDEEEERYQQRLEDEASLAYDRRTGRAANRALEEPTKKGIRLTRKQRAIVEAKAKESDAMVKLDNVTQRYLELLAGAGKRDSDDEDSSDSDSDSELDSSDAGQANPLIAKETREAAAVSSLEAEARADQWFSQPLFQDAEADVLATSVANNRANNTVDFDSDEDMPAAKPAKKASKKAKKGGRAAKDDSKMVTSSGVELDVLPLTEKEKRRQKRKKAQEKKTARATRKRKRDEDFEVVEGQGDDNSDLEASDEELTEEEKLKRKARRELIKAGMGKALTGDDSGDFEVVAAPESESEAEAGSGSDSDSGPDPRDEYYDSDTQAELLALGKKMRKHTTAKALIDASYNRYSFNDAMLPKWFAEDERRHFHPQLPVTKAEVDEVKRNIREITTREVRKVAEARARKKRRLMQNLTKAKNQANSIANSEDMGPRSKARAIAKLYRNAQLKTRENVYVVMRNGHQTSVTGGGKKHSGKVKVVDSRLKADTRGMKRHEARKAGNAKKKGTGGRGRKGRNKRQR